MKHLRKDHQYLTTQLFL